MSPALAAAAPPRGAFLSPQHTPARPSLSTCTHPPAHVHNNAPSAGCGCPTPRSLLKPTAHSHPPFTQHVHASPSARAQQRPQRRLRPPHSEEPSKAHSTLPPALYSAHARRPQRTCTATPPAQAGACAPRPRLPHLGQAETCLSLPDRGSQPTASPRGACWRSPAACT